MTVSRYVARTALWPLREPSLPALDIELTERCNNNCLHCCINLPPDDPAAQRELSTAELQRILREAAALGCLTVRFTGANRCCVRISRRSIFRPGDSACAYDLRTGSQCDALDNFFPRLRNMRATHPDYLRRCARCFLKSLCEQCPARSWAEHGTLAPRSSTIARSRTHRLARWDCCGRPNGPGK